MVAGLGALDAGIGALIEAAAALLVAAEIAILFAGVLARYVFDRPLVWSDELASMLFLWLAMLGAVIAFRRQEHMRMTAVVAMLPAGARAALDVFATGASLAFLMFIIRPALDYAQDQSFITTPAMEIADAWRAAAMPVGIGLMAVLALLRLARVGSARSGSGRRCSARWATSICWSSSSASWRPRCSPACRSPSLSASPSSAT
jgi:TRAP-type C4-dicarboxylate transport system permease small subunit